MMKRREKKRAVEVVVQAPVDRPMVNAQTENLAAPDNIVNKPSVQHRSEWKCKMGIHL